jgi:hypothetical protein
MKTSQEERTAAGRRRTAGPLELDGNEAGVGVGLNAGLEEYCRASTTSSGKALIVMAVYLLQIFLKA